MITMQGNFFDDDTRETEYIPTTVDASIPAILAYRGVPARRIAALLADLDGACSLADMEIDTLLPCVPSTGMRGFQHHFHVLLEPGVSWTGDTLTMRATLPETVLAAMEGKGLREVVDHPALPNRTILAVETKDGDVILRVRSDVRYVLSLADIPDSLLSSIGTRSKWRRAWIDGQARAGRSVDEWIAWVDDNRQKAVGDVMNGVPRTHEATCWGEPAPVMTAVARGAAGLMGRMGASLRRLAA